MRRVLAVLGALLMVAVALLVRSLIDGGDEGTDPVTGRDGGPLVLLCAEELADVCAALESDGIETRVEPVGETVDALSAPEADLQADGWLTLGPFPQQVDVRREFGGLEPMFAEPQPTDFSTPLALVAFTDRATALEADCAEVGWACLGDAAGAPWADHGGEASWGDVKPGYDHPDTSATGLLVLAQAMADHLDNPSFALQDLDTGWLGDLEDAVPTRTAGDVLLKLVQQGRAAFGAVGALGHRAEAAARTAQGEDLTIFYPAPMFRATVVLAPLRGVDLEDFAAGDALAEALADAGWDTGGDGEPLPSAGAIDALRTAWENT